MFLQVAEEMLYGLHNALLPSWQAYVDPVDDLVVVIEEGGVDWFAVIEALKDAFPNDRVVRYGNGFRPHDESAAEFFKRAKFVRSFTQSNAARRVT